MICIGCKINDFTCICKSVNALQFMAYQFARNQIYTVLCRTTIHYKKILNLKI